MRLLILLTALLFASPALAASSANWWSKDDCTGQQLAAIGGGFFGSAKQAFTCADNSGTSSGDFSNGITINANSAMVCLNPDTGQSGGSGDAELLVYYCISEKKPSTNPANSCISVTDAAITGVGGAAGTQNACVRVGPGVIFVEWDTAPGAGEEGRVKIFAEGG